MKLSVKVLMFLALVSIFNIAVACDDKETARAIQTQTDIQSYNQAFDK